MNGGPLSRMPKSSSSIEMSPKTGNGKKSRINLNKSPGAKVKFQIDTQSPGLR